MKDGRKPDPRKAARPAIPPRTTTARKTATRRTTSPPPAARVRAGPAKPKRSSAPATPAEVREAVLALVRREPGVTDDQLARQLKITKSRAAAHARALEKAGLIERRREGAATGNHPLATPELLARRDRERQRRREATEATALSDDEVRAAVGDWLSARGFEISTRGLDLLARRGDTTIALEALGGGKHLSIPRNAVPQSLGRLVERLGRGHTVYALAFPDLPTFRNAVAKLAPSVRRTLNLHAFFVRRGAVAALDARGRPTTLL